jgi:hypothetical protein
MYKSSSSSTANSRSSISTSSADKTFITLTKAVAALKQSNITENDASFYLKAIAKLCNVTCNRAKLGELGACEAVVALMSINKHFESAEVSKQGCYALWNLLAKDENRASLAICRLLPSLMRKHPRSSFFNDNNHRSFVMNCCGAMLNLCIGNDVNIENLGANGACKEVMAVFCAYPNIVAIQDKCCSLVDWLATNSSNRVKLLDACPLLVATLKNSAKIRVSLPAMCGIGTLVKGNKNNENSRKFRDDNACTAVVTAMRKNSKNANFIQMGCLTLHSLASSNAINDIEFSEVILAVVEILKKPLDIYTAQNACLVVSPLASKIENKILFNQLNARDLISKIQQDANLIAVGFVEAKKALKSLSGI